MLKPISEASPFTAGQSTMTGLIFLAALALCLYGGWWLVSKLGNLIPNANWRLAFKVLVFCALLVSPFVDEVIGKQQFEALCKANGIESADVSKARGKRVKGETVARRLVDHKIMPIEERDRLFKDADSSELLFEYKDYYAFGGWLMRYTPIGMGSQQSMLFPGNGCGLDKKVRIFSANQITQTN